MADHALYYFKDMAPLSVCGLLSRQLILVPVAATTH